MMTMIEVIVLIKEKGRFAVFLTLIHYLNEKPVQYRYISQPDFAVSVGIFNCPIFSDTSLFSYKAANNLTSWKNKIELFNKET
jgi:hypothetical protein